MDIIVKEKITGVSRLEKYKDKYDFNIQLFNGSYNIFVEKGGVDLYDIGGYDKLDDAIDIIVGFLKRINRESDREST